MTVGLLAGGPSDFARDLIPKLMDHGVDIRYHWEMDKQRQWAAAIPDDVEVVVLLTTMCGHAQQAALSSTLSSRNGNGRPQVKMVRVTHKAAHWSQALSRAGWPQRNVQYVTRAPSILYWESGHNLTHCGWQQETVDRLGSSLGENECVVFFNNSIWSPGVLDDPSHKNPPHKYPPKCRIYYRLGGQTVVLIPKVSTGQGQIDYQHVINQWLRETFHCPSIRLHAALQQSTESIQEYNSKRAERAAKKAAKAAAKAQTQAQKGKK